MAVGCMRGLAWCVHTGWCSLHCQHCKVLCDRLYTCTMTCLLLKTITSSLDACIQRILCLVFLFTNEPCNVDVMLQRRTRGLCNPASTTL